MTRPTFAADSGCPEVLESVFTEEDRQALQERNTLRLDEARNRTVARHASAREIPQPTIPFWICHPNQ